MAAVCVSGPTDSLYGHQNLQVGVLAQRVWGGRGLVNNSALPKDVDPSSARAQT